MPTTKPVHMRLVRDDEPMPQAEDVVSADLDEIKPDEQPDGIVEEVADDGADDSTDSSARWLLLKTSPSRQLSPWIHRHSTADPRSTKSIFEMVKARRRSLWTMMLLPNPTSSS